jgi:putative iron-only hydrogenase system regulator
MIVFCRKAIEEILVSSYHHCQIGSGKNKKRACMVFMMGFEKQAVAEQSRFVMKCWKRREYKGDSGMEENTRIAVIGIIVEDRNAVEAVNRLLHEYGEFVIGRMGLPYEKKKVNIISVVVDAPMDKISALSGKLGKLPGISAKTLYSKNGEKCEVDRK